MAETEITQYDVLPPCNGESSEFVLVYLHGYGENMDWQRIGELFSKRPELANAKIYFPRGPFQIDSKPGGYNWHGWYSFEDMSPVTTEESARRALEVSGAVNRFIDRILEHEGISEDRLMIAGYSQGGTVAYSTALMRENPVAGVFCQSAGALWHIWPPEVNPWPPLRLVAGAHERGDYFSAKDMRRVGCALQEKGYPVQWEVIPMMGHKVTRRSVRLLAKFAQEVFADVSEPSPEGEPSSSIAGPDLAPAL